MLDNNLKAQLQAYLERLQRPVELVASLDDSQGARELKELVRSNDKSLCHLAKRKRLALPAALQKLQELASAPGGSEAEAAAEAAAAATEAGPSYTPSAPSALVRQLGKASAGSGEAEATLSLKQNATKAFNLLVGRLDGVYAARASEAPADFKERSGLTADRTRDLHQPQPSRTCPQLKVPRSMRGRPRAGSTTCCLACRSAGCSTK